MPIVVFLLISKLDGPPSSFWPLSAAENRELPLKSYVFTNYAFAKVYHLVIVFGSCAHLSLSPLRDGRERKVLMMRAC